MWKLINFFCIPLLLLSQELEVHLPTRSSLKPLYLSFKGQREELKTVLETDLQMGGFCSVVRQRQYLEEALKSSVDFSLLKKEGFAYCLIGSVSGNRLILTAYDIEQGKSKTYPSIVLERSAIHKLSDEIHKDLFGLEGIASLRLIYTQREKGQGMKWLSEVWVCDVDGEMLGKLLQKIVIAFLHISFPLRKMNFSM